MNLRHLEHLLAVADTGSFSRAAGRLFITQSALSRSIQNLEEELGGQLLDRIAETALVAVCGQPQERKHQGLIVGDRHDKYGGRKRFYG